MKSLREKRTELLKTTTEMKSSRYFQEKLSETIKTTREGKGEPEAEKVAETVTEWLRKEMTEKEILENLEKLYIAEDIQGNHKFYLTKMRK